MQTGLARQGVYTVELLLQFVGRGVHEATNVAHRCQWPKQIVRFAACNLFLLSRCIFRPL